MLCVGKEIRFDLYNQSSLMITEEQIEQGFGPLEFERVLQYVAFPRLQIEKRPARSQRGKRVKPDGSGRDEYVFSEFMFPLLNPILSLETCLGSIYSSDVFSSSLHPLKQARLTPK